MNECNSFLVLLILLLSVSGSLHHSAAANICDLDESLARLDSIYRTLLEIESLGVGVSTLQKDLGTILSIYSETQYLYSEDDRVSTILLEEEICQKTVQLDIASKDLLQTSLAWHKENHNLLIYKTALLNGLSIILLMVIWNLALRLYYHSIKNYEVVKQS